MPKDPKNVSFETLLGAGVLELTLPFPCSSMWITCEWSRSWAEDSDKVVSCAEWCSEGNQKVCLITWLSKPLQSDSPSVAGTVLKSSNAKVAVFTCGIDIAQTETKGTVMLKNSEELLNFSRGEEKHMEKVMGMREVF